MRRTMSHSFRRVVTRDSIPSAAFEPSTVAALEEHLRRNPDKAIISITRRKRELVYSALCSALDHDTWQGDMALYTTINLPSRVRVRARRNYRYGT